MMQIFSLSLLLPIAYLSILIASMATFSHLYRRRQTVSKLRLAPYFPVHTTRNIYLSLLHLPDTASESEKPQKVPDSVLRAALFARACTDIERIIEIRTRKPALGQLLQRGVVGDEMMQRLTRAEQELELEIKDVVQEANALAPPTGTQGQPGAWPGWGAVIFQSAGETVQNKILREKLKVVQDTIPEERAAWEKVREGARKELMQGGTEEELKAPVANQERKGSVPGSDEDAVLVEKGSDESRPNTAGGASKKKKKNKNKGGQGQATAVEAT